MSNAEQFEDPRKQRAWDDVVRQQQWREEHPPREVPSGRQVWHEGEGSLFLRSLPLEVKDTPTVGKDQTKIAERMGTVQKRGENPPKRGDYVMSDYHKPQRSEFPTLIQSATKGGKVQ